MRYGKWHIQDNELCVSWGRCMPVEADGEGGYYKVKDGSKRVVHIISITDGSSL